MLWAPSRSVVIHHFGHRTDAFLVHLEWSRVQAKERYRWAAAARAARPWTCITTKEKARVGQSRRSRPAVGPRLFHAGPRFRGGRSQPADRQPEGCTRAAETTAEGDRPNTLPNGKMEAGKRAILRMVM